MNIKTSYLLTLSACAFIWTAQAGATNGKKNEAFDFWQTDGWSMFANDDGHVGPGNGGQKFDAEYLFYKYDDASKSLSIGIQTGFDIVDGKYVDSNGDEYYAGDLALSFDGDVKIGDTSESNYGNTYEYAVDFGLLTKDSTGETIESYDSGGSNGVDPAGLYRVARWDNDITYSSSSPFAMDWSDDEAYAVTSIITTAGSGYVSKTETSGNNLSYWRQATFNIDNIIGLSENFTVDAHWTMSCGNDAINGSFNIAQNSGGGTPVPEPSILALFGIGSLGIAFSGIRRRKLKL